MCCRCEVTKPAWRRLLAGMLLGIGCSIASGQNIDDFFPRVGTTNDVIQLIGSGFTSGGAVVVQFMNRKTATQLGGGNDAFLYVRVPSGAVDGELSIYRPGGSTNYSTPLFNVIGKEPYITAVSTNVAAVNDNIYIVGVHFSLPCGVLFGGVPGATVPDAGGSNIIATVPPGALSGALVVTNAFGRFTNAQPFTVVPPGPYIAYFNPTNGTSSSQVFINGWHFTGSGTLSVRFNGVPAASIDTIADNMLTVHPPANVTTGPISVGRSGVSTNTSTAYFYAPPSVTGFTPTNGIAGTSVTIIGQSLYGVTNVQFGGVSVVVPYSATNNTNLVVTVPSGAPSGRIRVANIQSVQFSPSNFRMLPTLTGFTPILGKPTTNVTIYGANLNEGLSSVKINGTNQTIGIITFDHVTVTIVNGTTTGPFIVTTTNGSVSSISNFYLPPQITSFSPSGGPSNTTVTITGKSLLDASNVSFNGKTGTILQPPTNTNILVSVPGGVITGPISVTTPGGTTNTGATLFYGTPVITSFSPTNGLPNTNVLILGTNLLGASNVTFNGASAISPLVLSNNAIQATVPGNATTGPIAVTTPGGTFTTSSPFTLDFNSDLGVTVTATSGLLFAGNDLTYTVVVTNKGPFNAPGVMLTNTLPQFASLKSASTTQGSLNTSANPILGTLNTLNVASSATVTIVVVPQTNGIFSDVASVVSAYTDPSTGNNSAFAAVTVYPVPVLSIQIYSPTLVQISWNAALTGFVLEQNNTLSSNGWTEVSTPPLDVGNLKVVIETLGVTPKFYRLKR